MIEITIPAALDEEWDEKTEEFIYVTEGKDETLCLEHSLVSISKWESKWCKPFFSTDLTDEEFLDYIKCMVLTPNVSPKVFDRLTMDQLNEIMEYLKSPMTATRFSNETNKKTAGKIGKEIVTSELVYYWMTSLNIPFECENWNLKRLLTLIRVCEIKNTPPKKRSTREIMQRNSALNAARRKKLNTKG